MRLSQPSGKEPVHCSTCATRRSSWLHCAWDGSTDVVLGAHEAPTIQVCHSIITYRHCTLDDKTSS